MKFKQFLKEESLQPTNEQKIHILMHLSENMDSLNESEDFLFEGVSSALGKVGLKVHKSKGILDYIKSFVTGAGKTILHIIKGDHDKAKDVIKGMEKEEFVDFLFKLDLGTLHLFTGPIHMIDAWTGWDLMANIKTHAKKADNIVDEVKQAIGKVKDDVVKLFSNDTKRQTKLLGIIKKFDKVLDVE